VGTIVRSGPADVKLAHPSRFGGDLTASSPSCLVVDEHPLVRLGLRNLLADRFEIEEASSRAEGVECVRDVGHFDVAIIDMRTVCNGVPEAIDGPTAIRAIHRTEPHCGLVAHGARPERHLATQAMQAGACAFVARCCGPDQLRRAVDAALKGESFIDPAVPEAGKRGKLTRRQRQILQLLADGKSMTYAADDLGLSEETVKTHIKNSLARLGARNRSHGIAIALRESLID